MQKIDKNIRFSTEYKLWLEELEANNEYHPNYNTYRKYYKDVKLELLRCQGGLCAYTEMRLCDSSTFSEDKWEDGRCKTKEVIESFGQLDHFDPRLKKKKGWLWSNLFVVHDHINTVVKRDKTVDDILKPDIDEYDLADRLWFKPEKNIFVANPQKTPDEQQRIENMIEVLGLNYEPVRSYREIFIRQIKTAIKYRFFDPTDYQNSEFPTALSFILEETETQN